MRRITPDGWGGIVMLVLCLVVGLPVLLGSLPTLIPYWAWLALFVLVLGCMCVVALSGPDRRSVTSVLLAVAVVGGWALVLTAQTGGLLDILLVIIAPLSVGVFPRFLVFVLIALNTAVIVMSFARTEMPQGQLFTVGFFYLMIQVAIALSISAIVREQRLRQELSEAHVELQAASVIVDGSARSAERLRISRELHDLIGHQLTLLTLELEAARHRSGAASVEHIARADGVARKLLGDVRATVSELRELAPAGLASALSAVGRSIPGLDVSVRVADDVAVDEEQSVVLVRALQEIVTNTLRHAGARELVVIVERDADQLRLRAFDDGAGVQHVVPGNGLNGLKERFVQLGGGAEFSGTVPGGSGFTVNAWMPIR